MWNLRVFLDVLLIRTKAELEWHSALLLFRNEKGGIHTENQSSLCLFVILSLHMTPYRYGQGAVDNVFDFLSGSTFSNEGTCLFLLTQLHLIHWNSTLFGSIDEAVGKPRGIAIIALFVQVNGLLLWLLYCAEMLISNSFCKRFFVVSHVYYLEVTLNTYTENTDTLKMENLISLGQGWAAIFTGRKWFIGLLELFFGVAFRVFGESS